MKGELNYNGDRVNASLSPTPEGVTLTLDGLIHEFRPVELGQNRWLLCNSHGQLQARVVRDRDRLLVWLAGRAFEFQLTSGDAAAGEESGGGEDEARAPMPGTLIKLLVQPGAAVEQGQVLAIIEAMKMEHQIRAPRAGIVEAVAGELGTIIDAGALVVSLAAEQSAK
ncbi:acetyl-CoA carboxylase biotin carboxyl carrier protein subunit [candidate division KSB1 bacterium]|nr:acetyl-CoA carboxylase biotin carboxyl carrier protein subunit [candidate division KSB1 bacterium]